MEEDEDRVVCSVACFHDEASRIRGLPAGFGGNVSPVTIAPKETPGFFMVESDYMLRAIELAESARGQTGTNPLVGAVIVKDGQIIGEGYHHFYGGDHAEVDALKNTRESAAGAEMFVSLEPCCHHGKTPPCTDAIIAAHIAKVHCAMVDPNPRVGGNGIRILRDAGIEVIVGAHEREAAQLNQAYIKYITTGLPFVTLKVAQTLDGKIADTDGNSKWITSEESRRRVHQLRSQSDAILIGGNTARLDNPQLTSHGVGNKDPLRLVLSRRIHIGDNLRLLTDNIDGKTILVTGQSPGQSEPVRGEPSSFEVWHLSSDKQGDVDLVELLRFAGTHQITNLLVEGGADVFSAFIRRNLVDKYLIVTAPKLLGNGKAWYSEDRRPTEQALALRIDRTFAVGGDLWIEAYPR
jgi:diaminohydroxyphosphoribosylaminopyrimidine deaminase / 5-amino-6-(5-phosphoribosylamino)uracil reductase